MTLRAIAESSAAVQSRHPDAARADTPVHELHAEKLSVPPLKGEMPANFCLDVFGTRTERAGCASEKGLKLDNPGIAPAEDRYLSHTVEGILLPANAEKVEVTRNPPVLPVIFHHACKMSKNAGF